MNEYEKSLNDLKAIGWELSKFDGVENVALEYPCYLSITFENANDAYLTLGYAQIDEKETPIQNRLSVQEFDGEGYAYDIAEFEFVENNPIENASNFIQCVLGSDMFKVATAGLVK